MRRSLFSAIAYVLALLPFAKERPQPLRHAFTEDAFDSFLLRMPSGIQGALSRGEGYTVETRPFGTNAFASYGIPAKLTSGAANPIAINDTAAKVFGLLIRPYPTRTDSTSAALGVAVPPTSGLANLMTRGWATVICNSGTPADQGQVYIWAAAASGAHVVGGIEAAGSGSVTSPAIVGTGTGTIAATIGTGLAPTAGTWVVTVLSTSNTAQVSVVDPNGVAFPNGNIGTAYKSGTGFNFTITAGGTMTAGDTFSPVVTENTFAVPGWLFNGPADASGNVEIRVNI